MNPGLSDRELELAYREALALAKAMWNRHFREQAPNWKPLPDLRGVISQIDNMVAGLSARIESRQSEGGSREDGHLMSNEQVKLLGIVSKMHTAWMQRDELMRQQGGIGLIERMADLLDQIADDVPVLWKAAAATVITPATPPMREEIRAIVIEECAAIAKRVFDAIPGDGDFASGSRAAAARIHAAIYSLLGDSAR